MNELLQERVGGLRSSPSETSEGLERIGVALSDPIRRAVLIALLDEPRCPSDLADEIGTTRQNLSNHLACLRGCGLVRTERAGRQLYYQLVSDQLADLLRVLLSLAAELPPCDEHLGRRLEGGGA